MKLLSEEHYLLDGYGAADIVVKTISDIENSDWKNLELDMLGCSELEHLLEHIIKWNKTTILHEAIYNIIYAGIEWYAGKIEYEEFIKEYADIITRNRIKGGLEIINSGFSEQSLDDNYWETVETISKTLTDAAFIILFGDRDFLYKFQLFLRGIVKKSLQGEFPDLLKKDGVLKRPRTQPPQWLKKAVFHRDKGKCQLCGKDLTGFYAIENINLDHMIPLEDSGNSDPTNFQLTCEHCNKSKGKKLLVKKAVVQRYW
ncbi:HNH endonuclease [Pseudoalteromonas sp. GCY]|uniref:HNH endonuclease n=1 Tax=Pseudoalteromonas sp. GCY TaxID=2003316 RepID=UPI00114529D7|nr:HNH endonuclease [Pseudoalteromonas sp. GCY]QQQ65110.1 HNH endonuclease [Pseudoalteromonas sp. GCY]